MGLRQRHTLRRIMFAVSLLIKDLYRDHGRLADVANKEGVETIRQRGGRSSQLEKLVPKRMDRLAENRGGAYVLSVDDDSGKWVW